MGEKAKTDVLGVRLEAELGQRVRDEAWRRRMTISAYLRQAAIEKLKGAMCAKEKRGETM